MKIVVKVSADNADDLRRKLIETFTALIDNGAVIGRVTATAEPVEEPTDKAIPPDDDANERIVEIPAKRPPGRPKKTAESKAEPKEKPEPEPEIDIMDVRKALTDYLAAHSEPEAAALLAEYGHTNKLSKLEPKYFQAVFNAATGASTGKDKPSFDDDIPL